EVHGEQQVSMEAQADKKDQRLLQSADARPQDQQRDEGRRGQITGKRDERLQEGLDRLIGAHQNAKRHSDDGRQRKAADDPPYRHADVEQEAVLYEEFPALLQHGQRVSEKGFRDMATEG